MLLILILKILFSFLAASHCIRWVSYHIRNRHRKTRVFQGNCRMSKDLEFALMYGLFAKRKKRVKDISYRKNFADWRRLLEVWYPPGNELFTNNSVSSEQEPAASTFPPTLDVMPMPSPKVMPLGNRKRKLFSKFKTAVKNFEHGPGGCFNLKNNKQIISLPAVKNLKIDNSTCYSPQ